MQESRVEVAVMPPGNQSPIFRSDWAEKNQQTSTTKCLGEIGTPSSAINSSSPSPCQVPQHPRIQDSREEALKVDIMQDTWVVYDGNLPLVLSYVWLR